MDTVKTYTYKGTHLVQETVTNVDGLLQEKRVFHWNDKMKSRTDIFSSSGKMTAYRTYGYDENRYLVSESLFDDKGLLKSRSEYLYDDKGRKVKWSVFDGDDMLLAYSDYIYEDGNLVRIENKNPGGAVAEYFVIEWEDDLKIRETAYENSKAVSSVEYFYSSDQDREIHKRANGSVLRQIVMEKGAEGQILKKEILDAKGKLQYYDLREYDIRTVTRMEYR